MTTMLSIHQGRQTISLREIIGDTGLFSDGDWIESKDQDPNGDVRLVQLADVGDGEYLDKSARYLTAAKAAELNCTFLKPGDLLIARMPDPLGRTCIFPGDPKPCVTAVDVCILRPDPNIADINWLRFIINSATFRSQLARFVTGTTRNRISRGNLGGVPISLPPLAEQRRIAAILGKTNDIRRKRREAAQAWGDLLYSSFFDLFGEPVSNSKKWDERRLGEISNIQSGVTKGRDLKGKVSVFVPYMRVANVQDGRILLDDVKKIEVLPSDVERLKLAPGDVLLTEGGDPDKLGRGAVWRGGIDPCIHQNHIFRVRPHLKTVLPDYLSMLIGSARGKKYFLRAAKQTTGIATINRTQLDNFPVLLPPIDLQKKFENLVKVKAAIDSRVTELEDLGEKLFSALVQRAFRAEL